MHKAGFVNIVGNPNVGKSTLMNQLVGERISIATFKAQTTRLRIMGIVLIDYAHDTMARGLRLECGNADALAYQLIHQRRLAHIRIAHYVYKSCFVHISFTFKQKG